MSGLERRPGGSPIELLFDFDSDLERFKYGLLPPDNQSSDHNGTVSWNDAAYGSLVNFPAAAKDLALDTAQGVKHMATHPVQTAASLKDLLVGTAQLPIPGEQGKEPIPRALMDMVRERYGGVEEFKYTLRDDSAGVLSDLMMLVPGVGLGAAGAFRASSAAGKAAQAAPDFDLAAAADRTNLIHMLGGRGPEAFKHKTPEQIEAFAASDLHPGLDGLIHFYEPGSSGYLDKSSDFGVQAKSKENITNWPLINDLDDWNPVLLLNEMGPKGAQVLTDKEIFGLLDGIPERVKDFDVIHEHTSMEKMLNYALDQGPDLKEMYGEALNKFKHNPDKLKEITSNVAKFAEYEIARNKVYDFLRNKDVKGFRYNNLYEEGNNSGGYSVGILDPSVIVDVK